MSWASSTFIDPPGSWSLVTNGFDRVQPRSLHRRVERRQRRDADARNDRHDYVERLGRNGQVIDEINLRIQLDELILAERERCRDAEQHAQQRADESDDDALREKYSADRRGG